MNLNEAKSRARQLNCQCQLKRQEEQILKLNQAQEKFQVRYDSVLPSEFVAEFEERFIRKKDSQVILEKRKKSRAHTAWRVSQRLIVHVNIEPSEWFLNPHLFYDYFYK